VARTAIAEALRHLGKARTQIAENGHLLNKHRYDESDALFRKASEKVADAIAALTNPTNPGVEAGDLPVREEMSRSIRSPMVNLGAFRWESDRTRRTQNREISQTSNKLTALGIDASKLSSSAILSRLAESGWGPEKLGDYVATLLNLVSTTGTMRQKVEVMKLLKDMIQHTEPRTLFEMKDTDLADLSEEDLEKLTRSAARFVARESARLQAGLPEGKTET